MELLTKNKLATFFVDTLYLCSLWSVWDNFEPDEKCEESLEMKEVYFMEDPDSEGERRRGKPKANRSYENSYFLPDLDRILQHWPVQWSHVNLQQSFWIDIHQ